MSLLSFATYYIIPGSNRLYRVFTNIHCKFDYESLSLKMDSPKTKFSNFNGPTLPEPEKRAHFAFRIIKICSNILVFLCGVFRAGHLFFPSHLIAVFA